MIQNFTGFANLFHVDRLSAVLIGLVVFVAISVGSFSVRYLKGDAKQKTFFVNLCCLILSVSVMVCANHMLLLLLSWGVSNLLLSRLMLHKANWDAAKQSSILALKNFVLGFIFLGIALAVLYAVTGETSLQAIATTPLEPKWIIVVGVFLLLAAMTQSAIWPFHRWLISSLNSPTPVSAIMHAGLINGGGFLLARFAPIIVQQSVVLDLIFIAGIATALLGTLWKLLQNDVKRMLACSTMGQMGFMIAQCGLGLFPAAVAHLCWHGLFKAYLFLASGAAAKEKRLDLDYPPSIVDFLLALICGVNAMCVFAFTSGNPLQATDTRFFLNLLAAITGTQFALPIIRGTAKVKLLLALLATVVSSAIYGYSVHLTEYVFEPMGIAHPQPLRLIHFVAASLLLASWLLMVFVPLSKLRSCPGWLLKRYVQLLNASQPHPKTITAHRNKYQY